MNKLESPPEIIKLMAHDLRWNLIHVLLRSDHRVNELVEFVGEPANAVSYHLKQMRQANLVHNRRSEADGRDVYYSLNLDAMMNQFDAVGQQLRMTGMPKFASNGSEHARVLLICTNNSARSQMAEGFFRAYGHEQVEVFSAGTHPTVIHQHAIKTMDRFGIDIRTQHSDHLNQYDKQQFDYVITVCDYAREICPTFDGGIQMHWGFADPAAVRDKDRIDEVFFATAEQIQSRVKYFLQSMV